MILTLFKEKAKSFLLEERDEVDAPLRLCGAPN